LSLGSGTAQEKVRNLLLKKRIFQELTLQYPPPQGNLESTANKLQGFIQSFEKIRRLPHGVSNVFPHLPNAYGHDVAWTGFTQNDHGGLASFFD
jgi:hypothetical protein